MSLGKRIVIYACVLLLLGGVAAFFVIRDFASTPFPPDISLAEFDPLPAAAFPRTHIWKPKYPVIDIHSHPRQSKLSTDNLLEIMDAAGVVMVVDLDGNWGREGERLERVLEDHRLKAGDRIITFVTLDIFRLGTPGFIEKEMAKLEKAAALGVRGVKIYKPFGLTWRDNTGKIIPIDDPRLDPIWEKIAALKLLVLIHSGNPAAFWRPLDRFNERYEELVSGSAVADNYYGKPDVPSHEAILQQRENLLRKHPGVTFIAAHMAGLGNDLQELSRLLDRYPNLYVDISDRLYEVGRQPYTARKFFIRYQDRLLFGIDLYPETSVYQDYYRILETRDEYIDYPRSYFKHGRWKVYGLNLPDDVLEKLYYRNAMTLLHLSTNLLSAFDY